MLLYLYLFAEYKCTGSQSSIREIDNKLITELFKAIFLLKNIYRYNFDPHESYFNSEDLQIMCSTKKIEKLNPKDPKIIYAQINDLLREVCEMNNRYTSSVGKKTLISNIKQFCDAIYEYEMLLKEFNQLLQNKIVFPALRCKERSPYFCFLEKIGFKNNPIDMFDLETKQQMNLKIKEIQEHLAHIKELREELKYTDNLCDKIEELINKNNLEKKAVVKDRTLKYLKDILQNKKDIDSFYEIEINNRMGESVFSKIKFFTSLQKIVTLDGNIADDLLQRVNRDELPILQEGRDLKLNLLLSILVIKMMGTLNELQLRTIIEDLKERAKTEIKKNQSEVAKIKTEINDLLLYLNQESLFQQEVKFKSEPAFLKSLQELETKIIKLFKSELQYVLDHGYIIGNLITFIKLAVKQVMPREAEFIDKDLKELRNREFLLLRDAMFKISLPPEITDLVNIDNIQLSKKNIFRMLLRIH